MTYPYQADHLDYRMAFHCAPVLAGLKTANLISLQRSDGRQLRREIEAYGRNLLQKGIRLYPLLESERRVLLFVYREALLLEHLGCPPNRDFLRQYGYRPGHLPLEGMLALLSQRLRATGGQYPHEIGVFLGYPLVDILGFIQHKGEHCKLCGYWKVYADADRARNTFAAYDAARDFYCWRVLRGQTIHTIQYGGYCT